jgi:hypothetical protein
MSVGGAFALGLCIGIVFGAFLVLNQVSKDLDPLHRWAQRERRK